MKQPFRLFQCTKIDVNLLSATCRGAVKIETVLRLKQIYVKRCHNDVEGQSAKSVNVERGEYRVNPQLFSPRCCRRWMHQNLAPVVRELTAYVRND